MTPNVEETLSQSQEWLKENTKRYAFKKLEREIIKTGICVECGTCVSNCPVDALSSSRVESKYVPELTGKCTACGICYAMCPRTRTLAAELIGNYLSIYKAQSKIEGGLRQDGGVATALLVSQFRQNDIEAAIVTVQSETPWLPKAKIATTEEDVLQSGGTIYTHTPIVESMMEAFRKGHSNLAVVGTACNLDAISRLENHPAGFISMSKSNVFKLGLFCMESFDYHGLKSFLKENQIDINDVTRMAIAGGKFNVTTRNQDEHQWPIADLDPVATKSCSYCHDLTAMNSDLSCGNIGSAEGWTTVIIRTKDGEKVFKKALDEGLIEAEEIEGKPIQIVMNVSRSKAIRYYKMDPAH